MRTLTKRPSLARRISLQVGLIAFVTSIIQLTVVIGHNYFDYEDLSLAHVTREATALRKGLSQEPTGLSFTLPARAAHYRDVDRSHYALETELGHCGLRAIP